jgi:predicted nucleotidyltransferase
MVYFPESVIITTKDGIQFKSFSNQHPPGFIIAKPKYIPTDEIFSDKLQLRNLFDKQVNRLNLWIDKSELTYYLETFKKKYPHYIHNSDLHKNWFFAIPEKAISQIFDPREGLKVLMNMPEKERDEHLSSVISFVELLLKSGISKQDLGITFSTIVGHYDPKFSDINIVIYGKENSWKVLKFLETVKHPDLRWKTEQEWEHFRQKRNRSSIFTKQEFFEQMSRKKTEGYFQNKLFVLFPVEKENETWEKWGKEEFIPKGLVEVEASVIDNYNSLLRPGYFEIKNSQVFSGLKVPVSKIVFYSRDYVMQALNGEKIKACGLLEEVKNLKTNKKYYRVVIGYFDSYTNERREKEYIKVIK